MMIEFYGIPGSGKSFYANQYKQKLSVDGKIYIDISRHSEMPLWLKLFYKMADYVVCILPQYRKVLLLLKDHYKGCSKEPLHLPLPLKYCIKDIVLSFLLHDIFGKTRFVVINDEGLLQRVATIVVNYGGDLTKLLLVCDRHLQNIDNLFIDLPVISAYYNIKKRNRHVCSMDELNETALLQYLNSFAEVCQEINSIIMKKNIKC